MSGKLQLTRMLHVMNTLYYFLLSVVLCLPAPAIYNVA